MAVVTTSPHLERLAVTRVVVPLDGTSRSEAAIPVARSLGTSIGASVDLVGVAGTWIEERDERFHLAEVAGRWGMEHETRTAATPVEALVALTREPGTLLCMSSHGRGPLSGSLLEAVTPAVLGAARVPVLVVGPHLDPGRTVTDGRVVACLDGSTASEEILPVAGAFAWALRVALDLVTVAEPLPPTLDHHLPRRLFGPAIDPQRYVEQLANQWRPLLPSVRAVGLYDTIGPAEGLRRYLQWAPAGMLAASTRARTGRSRLLHGSVGLELVRVSPVPVLLVPRPGHGDGPG